MDSRPDFRTTGVWLAATALAALAWWFGSGLQPHWWLTWLAPLPLLWLAPRTRARWLALAAFVAYAVGGLNLWPYLHEVIRLPSATIVMAIGGPALACMLAVLLYRRLLQRGHPVTATLAPATLWVAIEYVNSLTSPHGTWGSVAYYQMDALPVIQVAAVTGLWGISFWLWLLPAAMATQIRPNANSRSVAPLALALSLSLLGLGYGAWRLQAPAGTTLRIGLLSLDAAPKPAFDSPVGQALLARSARAVDRLAMAGAKIVVMPETVFASPAATLPALAQLSRQYDVILDVGIDWHHDPHAERNTAMVYQPQEASPSLYFKHHLIPGFESQYMPGDRYTLLKGMPRIGLAICKDMDFHDTGAAYAGRNAQLLLVPAWDFRIDGWLHARMAILRGVESGFAIARAASDGRLTLSDDRGRVLAEASSEGRDAELVGDLPLRMTRTPYTRWGDWFAWLSLIGLVVILVVALRGSRSSGGPHPDHEKCLPGLPHP